MIVEYSVNPDSQYAKNKKKAIKKNNGFCLGVPKTEENRCKCKKFREQQHEGWCDEGLYYKKFVDGEEVIVGE